MQGPVVLGLQMSPHVSGHAFKTSLSIKAEAPRGPSVGTRELRPIVSLGSLLLASVDHPLPKPARPEWDLQKGRSAATAHAPPSTLPGKLGAAGQNHEPWARSWGRVLPTVHGELFQMTADSDQPCLGLGMSLSPRSAGSALFPSLLSTPPRTDAFQTELSLAGTPGLRSRLSSIILPQGQHLFCRPCSLRWSLGFEERTRTGAGPGEGPGLGHSPEPWPGWPPSPPPPPPAQLLRLRGCKSLAGLRAPAGCSTPACAVPGGPPAQRRLRRPPRRRCVRRTVRTCPAPAAVGGACGSWAERVALAGPEPAVQSQRSEPPPPPPPRNPAPAPVAARRDSDAWPNTGPGLSPPCRWELTLSTLEAQLRIRCQERPQGRVTGSCLSSVGQTCNPSLPF
ncbi:hypothetical protein GH733_007772 [Mirounga leonina]|nr:hypothetical protein GH733_007772 [Mirounga leonina]